jgi:hypothetical protein
MNWLYEKTWVNKIDVVVIILVLLLLIWAITSLLERKKGLEKK